MDRPPTAKAKASTSWVPSKTVALLLGWTACALVVVAHSVSRLEPAGRNLAWLYFQPLVPPLLMVWLWTVNIRHFEAKSIAYEICFKPKEKRLLLSASEAFTASLLLTTTLATLLAAFTHLAATAPATAQALPPLIYALPLLLLLHPAKSLHRSGRLFFGATAVRALLPLDTVTWADFLLADMLTSLSKSMADLERAFCKMGTGPVLAGLLPGHPADAGTCSSLSWHALLAICWPFLVRFVQCVRVYAATGNSAQIFNALKYFSSLPAQLLSAVEHEYHIHHLGWAFKHTWLLAMAANSLYSFYWDIEQDWDMPWLAQPGGRWWGPLKLPALRSDALYPRWWYGWAAASNLALRMTWTYRLMGELEAQRTAVLLVACLEVFRRHQWAYIRIESELRKIGLKVSHSHPLLDE